MMLLNGWLQRLTWRLRRERFRRHAASRRCTKRASCRSFLARHAEVLEERTLLSVTLGPESLGAADGVQTGVL
ncbi:MAG: hypothetical protein D6725_09045, partial [Planctomycetota bacterium]